MIKLLSKVCQSNLFILNKKEGMFMMNRIIEGDLTQIQIFENNKVALIILTEKIKWEMCIKE